MAMGAEFRLWHMAPAVQAPQEALLLSLSSLVQLLGRSNLCDHVSYLSAAGLPDCAVGSPLPDSALQLQVNLFSQVELDPSQAGWGCNHFPRQCTGTGMIQMPMLCEQHQYSCFHGRMDRMQPVHEFLSNCVPAYDSAGLQ